MIRVAWVSPEVAPWSKTGGLGDVSGALPAALAGSGEAEVFVLSPRYRDLAQQDRLERAQELDRTVHLGGVATPCRVWRARSASGLTHLFVSCGGLFHRPGIYGDDGGGYGDNAWRYGVFCRWAAEIIDALGVHVVHANDWQSGFLFAHLERGRPRTVFTIHNMMYQGRFDLGEFAAQGLLGRGLDGDIEFWGIGSSMKLALRRADAVTTVSPGYAREIRTPEYGFGLQDVLVNDVKRLRGILNGVDPSWDPRTDDSLPARYGPEDLSGKSACRAHLWELAGWEASSRGEVPVVAMVARLTFQKGVDLALPVLARLLAEDRVRVALLGQGEPRLEKEVRGLAARFPRRCTVRVGYDEIRARLLEAGADVFLMPSRFEPCGLNQMYSMLYGTLPVVHEVGGLADTVRDADRDPANGTGFTFRPATPESLWGAMERVLVCHADAGRWHSLVQNAMRQDFGWARSAGQLLALYGDILSARD